VPDITDILINGLEQITVTENEVEDILKILDTSEAIGPYCQSNSYKYVYRLIAPLPWQVY
jgi:hypothetical protein